MKKQIESKQINLNFPTPDGKKITKTIYLTKGQYENISSLSGIVHRKMHNFIIHVLSITLDCEENEIIDRIEENGNGNFNKYVVGILSNDSRENGKEYFKKQRHWISKQQKNT